MNIQSEDDDEFFDEPLIGRVNMLSGKYLANLRSVLTPPNRGTPQLVVRVKYNL